MSPDLLAQAAVIRASAERTEHALVSIDLAVWDGPPPANASEARAVFDDLSTRFLDGPRSAPTERIGDYVAALLSRYPDLTDEGDDEVPWGSGPLLANASGRIVYIDMKINSVLEEGWRYCVDMAAEHGLIAFDPQTGDLADADPTSAPSAVLPSNERRGGPVYRWVSLRSWGWPFRQPLLRLLRRFL